MTTDTEIANAIHARLDAIEGLPAILWPNSGSEPVTPRLEVALLASDPEVITTTGSHRRKFLYQVTVVTEQHTFEVQARTIAETIISAFNFNDKLAPGLSVIARPVTNQGYPDETEYRLPVTIRLEHLNNGDLTNDIPQIPTTIIIDGGRPNG